MDINLTITVGVTVTFDDATASNATPEQLVEWAKDAAVCTIPQLKEINIGLTADSWVDVYTEPREVEVEG